MEANNVTTRIYYQRDLVTGQVLIDRLAEVVEARRVAAASRPRANLPGVYRAGAATVVIVREVRS